MLRIDWRMAILALLFLGPFAIFVGLGWAWVHERGWALQAFGAWILVSILFSLLSVHGPGPAALCSPPWTRSAPQTFAPRDREAWNLVQADAEGAERATPEELISIDFYVSSATHLSAELARFYHPKSTDPIEYVPLVDLLTAIELATEDLNAMIREIPGGDIVSLAHWKTAVGAANFVSRRQRVLQLHHAPRPTPPGCRPTRARISSWANPPGGTSAKTSSAGSIAPTSSGSACT